MAFGRSSGEREKKKGLTVLAVVWVCSWELEWTGERTDRRRVAVCVWTESFLDPGLTATRPAGLQLTPLSVAHIITLDIQRLVSVQTKKQLLQDQTQKHWTGILQHFVAVSVSPERDARQMLRSGWPAWVYPSILIAQFRCTRCVLTIKPHYLWLEVLNLATKATFPFITSRLFPPHSNRKPHCCYWFRGRLV